MYSYIKLNVQKDTHESQEYLFDLKQFPALSDKLLELGAASIEFARLVRIPANVTAHSGHRDRLAHQCSLAAAVLH